MRAEEVLAAVRRHYGCEEDGPMGTEWGALAEFTLAPGGGGQRIDLMLVRNWGGGPKGHERHAIEVKVSRGDLLAELKNPAKREPFERFAHRFWFATPAGLMKEGELPEGCGLLEVTDRGVRRTVVAPRREPAAIGHRSFVEAFRRASRAEARIRSAGKAKTIEMAGGNATCAERLVAVEASLLRARSAEAAAKRRVDDHRQRAKGAMALLGALHGEGVCRCGARVKINLRGGRGGGLRWDHVGEPGVDRFQQPCRWPALDEEAFIQAHHPELVLVDETL
jgi:hypothetical protein